MERARRVGRLLPVAAVVLGSVAVAACESEDPVVPLARGPTADSAFTASVSVIGAGLPSVSRTVDQFVFSSFSPEVEDAWARATTSNEGLLWFNSGGNYYWQGCGWNTPPVGASVDPRLPRPILDDADAICFWIAPNGDGYTWDFYLAFVTVPELGKKYALAIVRYGVKVNGMEDHEEVLLNGTVTEPDELIPIPNNPGGNFAGGTNWDEYEATGHCWDLSGAQGTANPLVLGVEESFEWRGMPVVYFDVVPCAGKWTAGNISPSNGPFPPNQLKWFNLPQGNYLVVFEANADGSPILNRPVARAQMGPDLAEDGKKLLRNGLGPFPEDPVTDPMVLAGLPGAISVPNRVTASFTNLERLTAGVYKAWFVNAGTGAAVPATGEYTAVDAEGNVVAQGTGSSFAGGLGLTHTLEIDYGPVQAAGEFTHLVLSIEESDAAAAPGDRQTLWVQTAKLAGETAASTATGLFGEFRSGSDPFVYLPSGTGKLGVYGLDELQVALEHVSRPPAGFYYEGWLVPPAGSPVSVGELQYRRGYGDYSSLRDADVQTIPGVVTVREIVSARNFARASRLGISLPDFDRYVLTLEPKAGDAAAMSGAEVLGASPPGEDRRGGS